MGYNLNQAINFKPVIKITNKNQQTFTGHLGFFKFITYPHIKPN